MDDEGPGLPRAQDNPQMTSPLENRDLNRALKTTCSGSHNGFYQLLFKLRSAAITLCTTEEGDRVVENIGWLVLFGFVIITFVDQDIIEFCSFIYIYIYFMYFCIDMYTHTAALINICRFFNQCC